VEWYELSPEEFAADEEAQKARQIAYYNTFYASEDGRAVLFDILKFVNCRYPDGQEYAIASLALIELYLYIRRCCGIRSEKDVIDAEGGTITLGD